MLMRGRCGLLVNCCNNVEGLIRLGQTPGKFFSKKGRRDIFGSLERSAKQVDGAKSVHVNDLSSDGMAMNINSPPGQMCRWFGEIWKSPLGDGGIRNSHQRVSIYSCW